jgi:hypothetical protein
VSPLVRRLDALQAAGFRNPKSAPSSFQKTPYQPAELLVLQSRLGFWGHSGLLLASTILVTFVKLLWKTYQSMGKEYEKEGEEAEAGAGVMDRCPWPFIFTHDPIQGLKDPPTWILVTWIALWRVIKMRAKVAVP